MVKMSVRKSYPYVPLFLSSLDQENNEEALAAVGEYIRYYHDKVAAAYEQVDKSAFASFVDEEIFEQTVRFTMKGILEEEYAKESFDEASYMERLKAFLRQMRKMSQNN